MKFKIILISLFIIGLGIFCYPIVSNLYATEVQYQVINNYQEQVSHTSAEKLQAARQAAKTYNNKMAKGQISYQDPFTNDNQSKQKQTGKSYVNMLNLGETMGYLSIPEIDVYLPIYHGTSDAVLSKGVGHLPHSSLPVGGKGTHTVLTAHRGLPTATMFRDLDEMAKGDEFYIKTLGKTLAYQVTNIQVVKPNQTDWLKMYPNRDLATLLTCTPYMINTKRLLVTGERVPYVEKDQTAVQKLVEQKETRSHLWHFMVPWGFIIIGLLFVIIIYLILRKGKRSDS